jgi:hypothetical protein
MDARWKFGIAAWLGGAAAWLAVVAWIATRRRWQPELLSRGSMAAGLPLERCAFHGISYDSTKETCPGCASESLRRATR